jgi:hypothetical protein
VNIAQLQREKKIKKEVHEIKKMAPVKWGKKLTIKKILQPVISALMPFSTKSFFYG